MEKISAKDMKQLIDEENAIVFESEIKRLKSGEVLKLSKSEWPLKSTPGNYYNNRMKAKVRVQVRGDIILIFKL